MNFKNEGIAEIEAIAVQFPNYTLGKILHSIVSRKPDIKDLSIKDWLFNVTDEDLYTAIETAKYIEKEF